MNPIFGLFFFLIGYVIVYYSVDYLIDEVEEYTERFNLSPMVFGILILGLDFEESVASIFGAINGLPQLSIGNLVGNTVMALIISFALPFIFTPSIYEGVDSIYLYFVSICGISLACSVLFPSYLVLFSTVNLVVYFAILYISYQKQKSYTKKKTQTGSDENSDENSETDDDDDEGNLTIQSLRLILIVIMVIAGGELLVRGAEDLISFTHISESFFGLVIMAFVTNVEEFWIMFKAIQKNQVQLGLSIGIGKILWNISIIFGICGLLIVQYTPDNGLILSTLVFLIGLLTLTGSLLLKSFNKPVSYVLMALFFVFLVINFLNI